MVSQIIIRLNIRLGFACLSRKTMEWARVAWRCVAIRDADDVALKWNPYWGWLMSTANILRRARLIQFTVITSYRVQFYYYIESFWQSGRSSVKLSRQVELYSSNQSDVLFLPPATTAYSVRKRTVFGCRQFQQLKAIFLIKRFRIFIENSLVPSTYMYLSWI